MFPLIPPKHIRKPVFLCFQVLEMGTVKFRCNCLVLFLLNSTATTTTITTTTTKTAATITTKLGTLSKLNTSQFWH